MKRMIAITAVILLIFSSISMADIIDIPNDYLTIQEGIEASIDGDTVLVQPGTYFENINFNGHNIVLASLFLTTQDTSYISQTIIDADSSGSVVTFVSGENASAKLNGFTIQRGSAFDGGGIFCSFAHPTIENNIIQNNQAFNTDGGFGGGILCILSEAIIRKNLIRNNYATGTLGGFGGGIYVTESQLIIEQNIISNNLGSWGGGGIYVDFSDIVVRNNVIIENTGSFGGGGLYLDEANPLIVNNVISENEASWTAGGGIYGDNNSNPMIINSIIWLNEGQEGEPDIMIEEGAPIVNYCNIFGGWPGEGNTSLDPHFRDADNGDYHLMSTTCGDPFDSPCIDIGDPTIEDFLIDCDWGNGELRSDMGAYGGGDSLIVSIYDLIENIPKYFTVSQNYPNPFNASTTICYSLSEPSDVIIEIYDILGRRVERLNDSEQPAGEHHLTWNSDDYPSGIYFYRIIRFF